MNMLKITCEKRGCTALTMRDGKKWCRYYGRILYHTNIQWCRKHDVV